jgi:hypothetical protein
MKLHNIVLVLKRPRPEIVMVVVIVPNTLTQEVQAVQMVQSFDVRGVATTVFLVDLHLVGCAA